MKSILHNPESPLGEIDHLQVAEHSSYINMAATCFPHIFAVNGTKANMAAHAYKYWQAMHIISDTAEKSC